MLDTSCVCPDCGGRIEKVDTHFNSWQWTCGGVSGDGCQSDFGGNTAAPLRFYTKRELKRLKRTQPEKFADARRDRLFFFKVFKQTGRLPPFSSIVLKFPPDFDKLIREYEKTSVVPKMLDLKQFADMTTEEFEELIDAWLEEQKFKGVLDEIAIAVNKEMVEYDQSILST